MNHFQPATADMAFILQSVLQAPQQLQALPAHAEAAADLAEDPRVIATYLGSAKKAA